MGGFPSLGGSGGPAGHAPLLSDRRAVEMEQAAPEGRVRDEDSLDLQQTAGNTATTSLLQPTPGDLVRSVVSAPGRSLEPSVAETVSAATGGDTSRIRVHEGPEAAEAAAAVDAEMFASGTDIVAPEGLDVSTAEGMFKAVHEVHHIVNQQAKGPVEGTDTGDGLRISDPGDRHEREADEVAAEAVLERFGRSAS